MTSLGTIPLVVLVQQWLSSLELALFSSELTVSLTEVCQTNPVFPSVQQ